MPNSLLSRPGSKASLSSWPWRIQTPVSHLVEDTLKPPAGEHVAEKEGNGYNSNSRECGSGSELV